MCVHAMVFHDRRDDAERTAAGQGGKAPKKPVRRCRGTGREDHAFGLGVEELANPDAGVVDDPSGFRAVEVAAVVRVAELLGHHVQHQRGDRRSTGVVA
jgi:hypothetical protein